MGIYTPRYEEGDKVAVLTRKGDFVTIASVRDRYDLDSWSLTLLPGGSYTIRRHDELRPATAEDINTWLNR